MADKASDPERTFVVHAGSGRELPDVVTYCRSAQSTLVELAMAKSLGLPAKDIVSVRNPEIQKTEWGIPAEHLQRHAYHQIKIEDGACSVMFETRVYGAAPYVDGVVQIVRAIDAHVLENRRYDIGDVCSKGLGLINPSGWVYRVA